MKFIDTVYSIAEWICKIFLLAMVVIVTIVVVGRFVFNTTPGWGEELAISCMIWFGLISSALAEHDGRHIRVSMVDKIYPKKLVRVLHILFYFLKLFFAVVLLVQGTILVNFNRKVFMSGIHLSEAWIYLAGPITGLLMLIFLIANFKKEVLNK